MSDPLTKLAQQASLDDYVFAKPDLAHALQGLTFGEEHRYYAKACQTAGAVYSTKIKADQLTVSVKLPDSLALVGMTKDEAERHERYLHNEMEKVIVWIIRWHQTLSQKALEKDRE